MRSPSGGLRVTLSLRFQDFCLALDSRNSVFATKGRGHGVIIRQYGAQHLGENGYTCLVILAWYYPDAQLQKGRDKKLCSFCARYDRIEKDKEAIAVAQKFEGAVIYNIYFPSKDNIVLFHGPFYKLRKTYFEKRGGARERGIAYISGLETEYRGSIGAFGASWELNFGASPIQRLYHESGGFSIVTRDWREVVLSKTSFDKKHRFRKAVYFDNGNVSCPDSIFEYEEGKILYTQYDRENSTFRRFTLFPCPTVFGTEEHSLLCAQFGDPVFYTATSEGDFCFYPGEETAAAREAAYEKILSGEADTTAVWDQSEFEREEWNPPEEIEIGENFRYLGEKDAEGKRCGRGRTEQLSGVTAYEGGYRDDLREGYGAYYYSDGTLSYYGRWKSGQKDGPGVSVKKGLDGYHVGFWEQGRLIGASAVFDRDGGLRSFGSAENGNANAMRIEKIGENTFVGREISGAKKCGALYSPEGKLLYAGEFENGVYSGRGVLFTADGAPDTVGEWKDGQCIEKR